MTKPFRTALASFGVALFASPISAAELSPFAEANAAHTIFHELGHALISEFELPVLGQEEDAVDSFATLEMIRLYEDDAGTALQDVAAAWLVLDSWTDREDLDFYDEHDLDAQRGYRVICHLYGSDPDAFSPEADWAELPEEERERCEFDGPQTFADWEALLEPTLIADETQAQQINITYGAGPEDHVAALKNARIFEWVAEESAISFDWPAPISLTAATCGEPNAYWDPEARTITLCYEMLDEWAEIEAEVYGQ